MDMSLKLFKCITFVYLAHLKDANPKQATKRICLKMSVVVKL